MAAIARSDNAYLKTKDRHLAMLRRRFRQAGSTTGFGQKAVGCVQHSLTSCSVSFPVEVSRYNKRYAEL